MFVSGSKRFIVPTDSRVCSLISYTLLFSSVTCFLAVRCLCFLYVSQNLHSFLFSPISYIYFRFPSVICFPTSQCYMFSYFPVLHIFLFPSVTCFPISQCYMFPCFPVFFFLIVTYFVVLIVVWVLHVHNFFCYVTWPRVHKTFKKFRISIKSTYLDCCIQCIFYNSSSLHIF